MLLLMDLTQKESWSRVVVLVKCLYCNLYDATALYRTQLEYTEYLYQVRMVGLHLKADCEM